MSLIKTQSQLIKYSRIPMLGVVVLIGLVTILGKGGGGAPPPAGPTPPTVTSMTPDSRETDVARDTTVTATFSAAMNAGTIDTSSFTLRDGQGALIAAAVTYNTNTNTATLTPNQPLKLLTEHTATLASTIASQEGAALSVVNWDFLTVDGQWGMPVAIEFNDTERTFGQQIAVNANGDALVVWAQQGTTDPFRISIWANSYRVGLGWNFPVLIEMDDSGNAGSPHVAINENGIGFAVWDQSDGMKNHVYANRYVPGMGWGMMPERIGTCAGDCSFSARSAQVAVDADGNALAAWEQEGAGPGAPGPDTVTSIWAKTYTAGAGWAANQVLLESDDTGNAGAVRIASSKDAGCVSQAVAVWDQIVGDTLGVWTNRKFQGVDWMEATRIDTGTNNYARRPALAMNACGDALAVWEEQNGAGSTIIWGSLFVPGAIAPYWEGQREISGIFERGAEDPHVAINAAGNGLAVFHVGAGGGALTFTNVWSARFDKDESGGGNWASSRSVTTQIFEDARNARIAIDNNGNGLAVWEQTTATRTNIFANRWTGENNPGLGAFSWGTEALIDGNNGLGSSSPQIGVDAEGRALAVWALFDSTVDSIWANRLE
jgi:hypothetical protein